MTKNPLRYLLLPVSLLRLLSSYKSFADPYLGNAGLNRRGHHVRYVAAHMRWRKNGGASSSTSFRPSTARRRRGSRSPAASL